MALPPLNQVPFQGINPAYSITAKGDKPDSNFLLQLNQALKSINEQVNAVIVAFNTATAAQDSADTAQTTADGAQDGVDQLAADQYVIAAPSPDLVNARVLTAANNVSFNTTTAAQIKIIVDALAILNSAPVALTKPLSTTSTLDVQGATTLDAGLKVTGQTETGSLDIDTTVTVATTAQVGYVTINIGGIPTKFLTG